MKRVKRSNYYSGKSFNFFDPLLPLSLLWARLSATHGVSFMKKKIVLNIDENSKKEMEEDVQIIEDNASQTNSESTQSK